MCSIGRAALGARVPLRPTNMRYADAVRGLLQLERDPEKRLKYLDFIDIYAALDNNEVERYRREYPEEATEMSAFAERFERQGEAKVLLRQLRLRFGDLPEEVRQRIDAADSEKLLEWAGRILTADSLDEVLH